MICFQMYEENLCSACEILASRRALLLSIDAFVGDSILSATSDKHTRRQSTVSRMHVDTLLNVCKSIRLTSFVAKAARQK